MTREPGDVHLQLWKACKQMPEDYEPYGSTTRWSHGDCSSGCKHFIPLKQSDSDWGICMNPLSHRVGLLTFEHQGCLKYEPGQMDQMGK